MRRTSRMPPRPHRKLRMRVCSPRFPLCPILPRRVFPLRGMLLHLGQAARRCDRAARPCQAALPPQAERPCRRPALGRRTGETHLSQKTARPTFLTWAMDVRHREARQCARRHLVECEARRSLPRRNPVVRERARRRRAAPGRKAKNAPEAHQGAHRAPRMRAEAKKARQARAAPRGSCSASLA